MENSVQRLVMIERKLKSVKSHSEFSIDKTAESRISFPSSVAISSVYGVIAIEKLPSGDVTSAETLEGRFFHSTEERRSEAPERFQLTLAVGGHARWNISYQSSLFEKV